MFSDQIEQVCCLCYTSDRHNRVYAVGGVAPTLQSAMGTHGGNIPLIVIMYNE